MVTAETLTAPVEVVTPAEALRLGRLQYPVHTVGRLTDGKNGACAIGAMLAGWGEPSSADGHLNWAAARRRLGGVVVAMAATRIFDAAERAGQDGDAAVLAYLAEATVTTIISGVGPRPESAA